MSWNVDDARAGAVGKIQVREPQIDRDSPRLLFGQAVGVDPGERADERGFSMVDVAGRADDETPRDLHHAAFIS